MNSQGHLPEWPLEGTVRTAAERAAQARLQEAATVPLGLLLALRKARPGGQLPQFLLLGEVRTVEYSYFPGLVTYPGYF